MPQTRERQAWERAVADGAIAEHYYPGTVVITCARCGQRWERGRYEGRWATIADRREAVRHAAACAERGE